MGSSCVPSKDPAVRLGDIVENIDRIERHLVGILNEQVFENDQMVYDAVERCLERISEAATKLGSDAELLCPGVPWAQIRALGNVLRHEYDLVQSVRLWYTVQDDLPKLRAAVVDALTRNSGK
jgi:uncharacterized protein with HEPN domain